MTHLFRYLLIVVLGITSLEVSAQYADFPEADLYQSENRRYGHLKHFGFYASAMGGWNYTEELAPFTNLTWIHVGTGDDVADGIERMLQRLREARSAGVQATLSIESYLFRDAEGNLRPEDEVLEFLVELRAQLEFEGLLETLAMIYPMDEPFRNFINARDPNFIDEFITGKVYAEVYEVLFRANELIKVVFPDQPIGVILSGYEVFNRFLAVPTNYDWVGFDCYDDLFRSCDNRSFVEHYERLLDLMQPEQHLMAVPEAWVQNADMDRPDWPEVLNRRLLHHYEIALNEPRFIAFIPFLWSFDSSVAVPGLGLNRMAELFDDGVNNFGTGFVNEVKTIGMQIKSGLPLPPNMSYSETENSRHRPQARIRGEIMSVTSHGLISAWAVQDALPHKNLRVQIRVRDNAGNVVFKSRIERTFVHDPLLADDALIGQPFIGLHGYRYQLPAEIVDLARLRWMTVEMVVYEDGDEMSVGHIATAEMKGVSKPPPVVKRPINTIFGAGENSVENPGPQSVR